MDKLFFSRRLMKQLNQISACSLSALEAPAGYGKTTAVHKALDGESGTICWYTSVESVPDGSFRWMARQIGRVDEKASQRLLDLGYLNRSNAGTAAEILLGLRTETSLTLVFDNFQYAVSNWPPQVIDALAKRPPDGFRVILISQYFGWLTDVLRAQGSEVCYLKRQDFLLTDEDIYAFAQQMDIPVTEQKAREIYQQTDGWATMVAMILEDLRESGEGRGVQSVNELLYEHFWIRQTANAQDALLRVCMFDRLSIRDAETLTPEMAGNREELIQMIQKTPLVAWQPARHEIYPHEILLRFLREQLEKTDPAFRHEVFSRSGRVHLENGSIRAAVNCFYKAGDYEGILSCPLVCLLTEKFDGVPYTEVARNTLQKCPEALLSRYPVSVLRLCYALYAGCEFDEFDEQMERILPLLQQLDDPQILGEWYLVDAFSDFPDLRGMKEKYLKAEQLMTEPSAVFIPEEPFMFGCSSMWYLFFNKPGTMLETADAFAETMKVYNRLTNDHGAGAAEIYRGEAYSVQGRFEESDIQAYQAAFLAEQSGNVTMVFGVALLLGINAIYRSDLSGLQKAVDYLENKAQRYPFLQGTSLGNYMVETVRGYLLGLMMETGRSALWTQGEADSLADLTFTNFMIKTCRITDLLLKKEYKRAIASVETSLEMDSRLISTPTRNFMYCGLALAYMAVGRLLKAAQYLDKSLELAGQDRNYTFLACFRKYFQVLFLMPQIASKHGKTIQEIKAMDIRYSRADETHIFAMPEESLNETEKLTERERDVAELAAKGLHNNEIADRLFISENTVKRHLKSAFQKLNIDRRSRLVEMLR